MGQFDGTILAQQRRKSAIHLQIVEFSSNFRMKIMFSRNWRNIVALRNMFIPRDKFGRKDSIHSSIGRSKNHFRRELIRAGVRAKVEKLCRKAATSPIADASQAMSAIQTIT